ncbi:hypothetical protein NPIL_634281 [Nephila pilipes]|uniref:Uncharacterized protein n=1 Tax=Nephila pilipes TaxID=299642 RepID=A0A8X6NMY3_NEPPI|nr:hypothetical protein NPIL_634281 [Nephila pilipes]
MKGEKFDFAGAGYHRDITIVTQLVNNERQACQNHQEAKKKQAADVVSETLDVVWLVIRSSVHQQFICLAYTHTWLFSHSTPRLLVASRCLVQGSSAAEGIKELKNKVFLNPTSSDNDAMKAIINTRESDSADQNKLENP